MIARIERDEWVNREKVGRLLAQLGARPLRAREIRSSVIGHVLSFLCRFTGWFLPMHLAGKLETQNVCQSDKAAEYAAAVGQPELIPDLMEMAAGRGRARKVLSCCHRAPAARAAAVRLATENFFCRSEERKILFCHSEERSDEESTPESPTRVDSSLRSE